MALFSKKTVSPVIDWAGAQGVWLCSRIIPLLPLPVSYTLARVLSYLSFYLFTRQKKTILGNMTVAFGTRRSDEEKRTIARKMVENTLKGFFECFYLASPFKGTVSGIATVVGKHHLEEALARGGGVIILSAHFGSFVILGSFMSQEGYPFHMVLKEAKNKALARLFQKFRRAAGQQWIPTTPWRECQKRMLRCLRNNEIICLIADEYKRYGGVEVDFFGHKTPTATGPAVLSLRTGAAILPLFIIRQNDDTHRIIIEKDLEYQRSGNQEEDILAITCAFTRRIEYYVKKYPAQWLWTNRRWKKLSRGDKHFRS